MIDEDETTEDRIIKGIEAVKRPIGRWKAKEQLVKHDIAQKS